MILYLVLMVELSQMKSLSMSPVTSYRKRNLDALISNSKNASHRLEPTTILHITSTNVTLFNVLGRVPSLITCKQSIFAFDQIRTLKFTSHLCVTHFVGTGRHFEAVIDSHAKCFKHVIKLVSI